jgi:Tol biopolymer transport system component
MKLFTFILSLTILLFTNYIVIAESAIQNRQSKIQLLSRAIDGSPANDNSNYPSISANGRWVVFASRANNLVADDTNECIYKDKRVSCSDIFLYDRQTDHISLISMASDGTFANDDSFSPGISADGQWIVFASHADNLVLDDTNGVSDIFLHYRQSGITRRISIATDGTPGNERSFDPFISTDGQSIAFTSESNNLIFGDTNGVTDVFLHDRVGGITSKVSFAEDGQQSRQHSWALGISSDGKRILFGVVGSPADELDLISRLFIHHQETGITEQIVEDESRLGLFSASLSADGQWVALQYFVGHWDIFVQEIDTGNRQQVSLASDGTPANFDSFAPAISADGDKIVFSSRATNLTPVDTDGIENIFIHHRQTGETTLLSQNQTSVSGDALSELPAISADGQSVAFVSFADNLVADDANEKADIFVVDVASLKQTTTTSVSRTPNINMTEKNVFTTGFAINDIAISPNSEMVAIAGQGGVVVHELSETTEIQKLWIGPVNSTAWSSDSLRLATAGWGGDVPIWNVSTSYKVSLLGVLIREPTDWYPKVAWSLDGEYAATNNVDENIYVWQVISATTEIILNDDGSSHVTGLAWSPDGKKLVVSDKDAVRIWDIATTQSRVIMPSYPYEEIISGLAWSADGRYLAFGTQSRISNLGQVHLWELSGNSAVFEGHTGKIYDVTWSPDGILVTGSTDGVWLWDITTGQHQSLIDADTVTSVDWSSDGRYLVAGTLDGDVYVWEQD